jgi:hypothetical protein
MFAQPADVDEQDFFERFVAEAGWRVGCNRLWRGSTERKIKRHDAGIEKLDLEHPISNGLGLP